MSDIRHKLEEFHRKTYLKAHEGEDPFPLDGSEWARLLRERQYFEKHHFKSNEPCNDFLARLHSRENRVFSRVRAIVEKAMCHWFTFKRKENYEFPSMSEQLSADELAKERLKILGERVMPDLAEAERQWLSQRIYSSPDHALCQFENDEFFNERERKSISAFRETDNTETLSANERETETRAKVLVSTDGLVPEIDANLPMNVATVGNEGPSDAKPRSSCKKKAG